MFPPLCHRIRRTDVNGKIKAWFWRPEDRVSGRCPQKATILGGETGLRKRGLARLVGLPGMASDGFNTQDIQEMRRQIRQSKVKA